MNDLINQTKLNVGMTHRVAQAVMVLIIVLNSFLAISLVAAANSTVAASLNSQNVYVLAGIELVLLFAAYIGAKYEPIPTPV